MQGKPEIAEIAKAFMGFAPGPLKWGSPLNPQLTRVNVLTDVRLWPTAIKLNP